MSAQEKRLVLITGANQGVGWEAAANLICSSAVYHVLVGSRDAFKGDAAVARLRELPCALGTAEPVTIDVTSDDSVSAAADHVRRTHGRLDTLVCNAGIFSQAATHRQVLRDNLAVNTLGTATCVDFFTPLLEQSAEPRLVLVTSSLGSFAGSTNPQSRYYVSGAGMHATEYRASKAAVNMLMVQYSKTLGKDKGFKVFCADPGPLATNLLGEKWAQIARERGADPPSLGGELEASIVKGERDADVGKVCGRYGVGEW